MARRAGTMHAVIATMLSTSVMAMNTHGSVAVVRTRIRDGSARPIGPADLAIEPAATWRSPRSGAVYPARWTIRVAGEELALAPLVPDCELDTAASTGVVYWEGPVEVGGAAAGRGYAELTGYAKSLARRF